VGAVGIDVERIRDEGDALELADRFFSKKEAAWLRSQVEEKRCSCFFSCWTAKEAYVKAHGGGLSVPLNGFAVIPHVTKQELQLEVFGNASEARRWSMWQLELPAEFRGAVAVEGTSCRVRAGWLLVSTLFAKNAKRMGHP
jgi:4'-phosphopantetheinyl transferase